MWSGRQFEYFELAVYFENKIGKSTAGVTPTRTDERLCADRRLPSVLEVIWIGVTLKLGNVLAAVNIVTGISVDKNLPVAYIANAFRTALVVS